MATRERIVEEARDWIGVSWKHQGRQRSGIDCVGLPIVIAWTLGMSDFDFRNYPHRPNNTFLLWFEKSGCTRIRVTDSQDGDLLVFSESNTPCHCGIRSTKDGVAAVIHAHAKRRHVIEERLETAASVVGFPSYAYRMPNVED